MGGRPTRRSSPAAGTRCAPGDSRRARSTPMQLNLLPTIQQAISNLLTVYEPEFLRFGHSLFLAFATILIVWQGVKMMFSHDNLGDSMFDFAKLLLLISFGY